jgi:type III restriction enzyme
MAQTLEDMDDVKCYVKNHNLGFTIPYTLAGNERLYIPDFIAIIDDGYGKNDPLQLIIEVTGERKKEKAAKAATAKDLWVPAVNNYGRFNRWSYLEISGEDSLYDAPNLIRAHYTNNPFAHWFQPVKETPDNG